MSEKVAIGHELTPLPDGNVLVEFYGDKSNEQLVNRQVVTAKVVRSLVMTGVLADVALRRGTQVAVEVMRLLNVHECVGEEG